mmetsp:Transcript_7776/g.10950  ORF Transcript_7776/g.10950 Transcript_7776/m.10950 type:complete len:83 (-) Transcript_7776:16-264(-)
MGKRFRPPPTAPPKPRLDCTLTEHLQQLKEQEKPGSSALAAWEKEHSRPDDAAGAVQSQAMMQAAEGPEAPKKAKKKETKKE